MIRLHEFWKIPEMYKIYIYSLPEPPATYFVSYVMIGNETDRCPWRLFYNESNIIGREVAAVAAFHYDHKFRNARA